MTLQQIVSSKLSIGEIPIWVEQTSKDSTLDVLVHASKYFTEKDHAVNVACINLENVSSEVFEWCRQKNWTIVEFRDIVGTEPEALIAFLDVKYPYIEVIRRVRTKLVLVTQ